MTTNAAVAADRTMPDDEIDIRIAADAWRAALDDVEALVRGVLATAGRAESVAPDCAVLLTDAAEMHALNARWRGQDKTTNVLSFPAPDEFGQGDIALGYEVVAEEARAQGKSMTAHATHLLIHGFLHLLGYDHTDEADAAVMEAREREILAQLGIADPYVELAQ
jgi:probable rRNA maturation factor